MSASQLLSRAASLWIAIAVPMTILAALVHLAVQQDMRHTANDPQIALAEDGAQALAAGRSPDSIVPRQKVEISRSLSPFVMVLDDTGRVLASSGVLDGRAPRIPAGVLDYVRQHGQERVTWQPRRGVRSALVVIRYQANQPGFVASGRSLREVENRVGQLSSIIGIAWVVMLLAAACSCGAAAGLDAAVTKRNLSTREQ